MIALVLLIPLLLAVAIISVSKSYRFTKYVALTGSAASLGLLLLVNTGSYDFVWFSVGSSKFIISLLVTPLNFLLLAVVLLIGLLTVLYSFSFMQLPSEQRRYYLEILAFEAAMLAFAMSGSFVLLFIAWEFLSLTSYLLIGFWNNRERANKAARKAVTIILLGDIALLSSIVIFFNAFGTLRFLSIISAISSTQVPFSAVLLLAIAVFTKSAQFPFHEWLIDAMEGPTPVSAYLHSSTMVKAGVFTAIVLYPIFSAAHVLNLLLVIGSITVVVSTLDAMCETQVKKVLAYSTIQELGLMLLAIGNNALLAAIYFFFIQSFYKALLFFSAGTSMRSSGEEDIRKMSGLKSNKIVYLTALFGVLALAGFLPFSGFFSSLGISSSFTSNLFTFAFISLISLGTSFYIFRWFMLLSKKSSATVALSYKVQPLGANAVVLVLAALTLASSIFFFFLQPFFSNSSLGFITQGKIPTIQIYDAIIETLVVGIGAYIAYGIYASSAPAKKSARKKARFDFLKLVYTPTEFNFAYASAAGVANSFADGLAYFEAHLNEALDWIGHSVASTGMLVRRTATGETNTYVAIFAVGMFFLLILLLLVK